MELNSCTEKFQKLNLKVSNSEGGLVVMVDDTEIKIKLINCLGIHLDQGSTWNHYPTLIMCVKY